MHGHIMIGATSPALNGYASFVNRILGNAIHATMDRNGLWFLANGVMINPNVASTSLLKGIAISGIAATPGLTVIVAGLIKLIKALYGKMDAKSFKLEHLKELRKTFGDKMKNRPPRLEKPMKKAKKLIEQYRNFAINWDQLLEGLRELSITKVEDLNNLKQLGIIDEQLYEDLKGDFENTNENTRGGR
jgi:hypothetical protein